SQLVGMEGLGLSLDEVAGRGRVPRPRRRRLRPALARARAERRAADGAARAGHHGRVARRGPAPARALPVDPDPPAVAVLADARLLRDRRLRSRPDHASPSRTRAPSRAPPPQRPHRAPGRGHRDLHRDAVRPGQGPRPLAVGAPRPAPPRAGADVGGRPLWAVLATLSAAPQRPARRGRSVGPARHRGRAPGRAPDPGRRALHDGRARPGPPAAVVDPLGAVGRAAAGRAPGPVRPLHLGASLRAGSPADSPGMTIECLLPGSALQAYPPADRWDDWTEYDVKAWPRRVERHYTLVPTICFNCEAACGLL